MENTLVIFNLHDTTFITADIENTISVISPVISDLNNDGKGEIIVGRLGEGIIMFDNLLNAIDTLAYFLNFSHMTEQILFHYRLLILIAIAGYQTLTTTIKMIISIHTMRISMLFR